MSIKFNISRKKQACIGVIILLAISYYFWHSRTGDDAPLAPAVGVRVTKVTKQETMNNVSAFGSLHAEHNIQLRSEVAGIVTAIPKASGSAVAAGETLLSFDNAAQRANLQKAESAATLSNNDFKRVKILYAQKVVTKHDFETRKNLAETAQAELAMARDALTKTIVKAPFAGKLGIWQVNEGDSVAIGAMLNDLVDNQPMNVRYSLPERYLSQIAVGQVVHITTTAYPGKEFVGKVSAISPIVDHTSRNIGIEALIDNNEGLLSPGLSAEIKQQLGKDAGGIVVPEECLVYSIEGTSVFRIVSSNNEDNGDKGSDKNKSDNNESKEKKLAMGAASKKVEKVIVKAGTPTNGVVPIIEGLAEGDLIVSEGVQKVRDGQEVTILKK